MFVIDKHKKIILTQGDTATMNVEVYDLDNKKYTIKSDDEITLTVRKTAKSDISFSEVADNKHHITINPGDTKNMSPGLYVYDVQLKTADDNIYTIVPISYFELQNEVTR